MSTCPFQLIVLELYLHLTSFILPPSSFLRPENVLISAERDVLYERFVPQYMFNPYFILLFLIRALSYFIRTYLAVLFFITRSNSVDF